MPIITRIIRFLRIGVGISDTDVEYADSTSSTVAPNTGWQTTAPKWQNGHFIWSRTRIYYTNGQEKISNPVCLPSGKGVVSIVEQYYQSASSSILTGGTWVSNKAPAYVEGKFIWTRSVITYTDGSSTATDAVCVTGSKGDTGDKGDKGSTGSVLRGPQLWNTCINGYRFEAGGEGEEWKDAVLYNGNTYSCIKTHVKTADNYPGSAADLNNHYWRLGQSIELIIAHIILAQYQMVENLGVRTIEMKDKDGNVVFRAKDGDLTCKGGNFENITATGNFKSRNEKTWNEIEMNADKGYLVMRGPTSVNDDDWDLPSSIAEMTDLFKVKFETDSDSLSRIATMDLFGFGGMKRVNIDPEFGLRIYSNEGTDEESHLFLGKDSINYSDGLGHVYHSDWNSLLKKIL